VEVSHRPPEGTIALLFTDIEGSTRLAAALGAEWAGVLASHNRVIGEAIEAEGGFVDGTEGDAFFATFVDAMAAARAAVAGLRALRGNPWPDAVGELLVRMGLHVGYVERRATGYVGLEVHRAARVAAAAHGGQLLLTAAASALVGDTLATESLGVHRLKDFPAPEPLFCAVVDGRGASSFPPPRTHETRPTNLPAGSPALVGRDEDLLRIRSAFLGEGERLVTVTGRGGAGKTSLALTAAASLLDEHPGGVWLVRLSTAPSADDFLPAVAAAVGADASVFFSPRDAVLARLRDRGPVLLVLDNLEHLLAAGPAVDVLLDELPELRILVTSQAPLRLARERCLPVDALDPEASLTLIERVARRRGATVSIESEDRTALLEIAGLLDGLPLGLELAAARLGVLSPVQLLERLRSSPDVLRDTGTDRPDRQRSLRAMVEWTLRLIAPEPQALFVRMGAFVGPVPLVDLEAVAGADGLDVLEALAVLLEVALVRRVEYGDGVIRFGLPEALRQIAEGMLDELSDAERWRSAHARRQLELTWAARSLMVEASVFGRAVAAGEEATAALRWARAARDPIAPPLAAARAVVLADTGHAREAQVVLEPLLEHRTGEVEVDTLVLGGHGFVLACLGRMDEALIAANRAVQVGAGADAEAFAFMVRGLVHTYRGEGEASVRNCSRATELAQDIGPAALACALLYEAQARSCAGQVEQAAEQVEEAARLSATVEAKAGFHLETLRGDLAVMSARLPEALEHYARSLEAAQARGDQLQIYHDLGSVADVLARLGEDVAALEAAGIAEAQALDVRGIGKAAYFWGDDAIIDAQERVGLARAAELRAGGHAVPALSRVTAACRFARQAAGRTATKASEHQTSHLPN
jgi:class 3 adenylate cyclase/predicted ATPase